MSFLSGIATREPRPYRLTSFSASGDQAHDQSAERKRSAAPSPPLSRPLWPASISRFLMGALAHRLKLSPAPWGISWPEWLIRAVHAGLRRGHASRRSSPNSASSSSCSASACISPCRGSARRRTSRSRARSCRSRSRHCSARGCAQRSAGGGAGIVFGLALSVASTVVLLRGLCRSVGFIDTRARQVSRSAGSSSRTSQWCSRLSSCRLLSEVLGGRAETVGAETGSLAGWLQPTSVWVILGWTLLKVAAFRSVHPRITQTEVGCSHPARLPVSAPTVSCRLCPSFSVAVRQRLVGAETGSLAGWLQPTSVWVILGWTLLKAATFRSVHPRITQTEVGCSHPARLPVSAPTVSARPPRTSDRAGRRTSASTIARSSTMSQPTAILPRSVSMSRRSCKARSTTTVLATDRADQRRAGLQPTTQSAAQARSPGV